MKFRRAEATDAEAIRDMHFRGGYGFPMPEMDKLLSSWVAEENGKIVGWGAVQLQAEIISVLEPTFGSANERMVVIAGFHRPVAQDLRKAGFEKAFCNVDPAYPRFAARLVQSGIGWVKAWETLWCEVSRILGPKAPNNENV